MPHHLRRLTPLRTMPHLLPRLPRRRSDAGTTSLIVRRLSSLPRSTPSPKMYSFDRPWLSRTQLNSKIASMLSSRGWDKNHLHAQLDEDNICSILNDLFDESSDAALCFYFFRWSQRLSGSKHGLRATCRMVTILAAGNMNHIAMKYLKEIVGSEKWRSLVLDELREAGGNREVLGIVYSMLVGCHVNAGFVDLGIETIRKIKQFGFCPTVEVYNSLIGVLLRNKQLELAWQVFEEMPEWGNRSKGVSVGLFIREFCKYGDFASACRLLLEMENFSGKTDIVGCSILIDYLCKGGFLKEAIALFYRLVKKGHVPDRVLISSVVDGYCKVRKLLAAKNILTLYSRVPDVFVYNSFIMTLCRNGNVAEAEGIFIQMFDLGIEPDSFNYTTLMDGYCKLCEINEVMRIFAQMLKREIRPTVFTYTVLIEAYCRIEDLTGAEYVFASIKREGLQPDAYAYNALIKGYCKKGFMHKAYELKHMMNKDGVSPDATTYNIIMHGLIKRGYMQDSRNIFNELIRRGFFPDKIAFTNLIDSYSKEGSLNEAYLIWCSMSTSRVEPDVVTCSALLHGFCQKQRMDDAKILFCKMMGLGLKPDLILYNTLIRGFCNIGDVNEAFKLLILMKEGGIFPDNTTYQALVYGLKNKGTENAEKIAALKVQDTYLKSGFVPDEL